MRPMLGRWQHQSAKPEPLLIGQRLRDLWDLYIHKCMRAPRTTLETRQIDWLIDRDISIRSLKSPARKCRHTLFKLLKSGSFQIPKLLKSRIALASSVAHMDILFDIHAVGHLGRFSRKRGRMSGSIAEAPPSPEAAHLLSPDPSDKPLELLAPFHWWRNSNLGILKRKRNIPETGCIERQTAAFDLHRHAQTEVHPLLLWVSQEKYPLLGKDQIWQKVAKKTTAVSTKHLLLNFDKLMWQQNARL